MVRMLLKPRLLCVEECFEQTLEITVTTKAGTRDLVILIIANPS